MTEDKLRSLAHFYDEIDKAAGLKQFLKEYSSFGFFSGSRKCEIPYGLQYRFLKLAEDYYEELKERREKL